MIVASKENESGVYISDDGETFYHFHRAPESREVGMYREMLEQAKAGVYRSLHGQFSVPVRRHTRSAEELAGGGYEVSEVK